MHCDRFHEYPFKSAEWNPIFRTRLRSIMSIAVCIDVYIVSQLHFCAIVLRVLNHVIGCTNGMTIKGEVNKNEGIGRIRKFWVAGKMYSTHP